MRLIDADKLFEIAYEHMDDTALAGLENALERLPNCGCRYWDMESNYCALSRPTAESECPMCPDCPDNCPLDTEE